MSNVATTFSADDIYIALCDVNDPEVPLNIVELGLVYRVEVALDTEAPGAGIPGVPPRYRAEVDVTMTSTGCPAHEMILEKVRNRLAGMPQLSDIRVTLVWEPAWTPQRIIEAGRQKLGI
ncbi:metal-sulfur cluster assembly factor [Silvibacterium sp.]|uniref:metal-sulfur cluster assembly factor n=1 Tax=Silvibacterium sp. TaxID=1964179 RepID=UPI0039E43C76